MIIDGTQGTADGDGLVQCINQYGNIYEAARCYNSGAVDASNLNNGEGATASYVNDIANRMTGWVYGNDGNSAFGSCTGSYPADTCSWGYVSSHIPNHAVQRLACSAFRRVSITSVLSLVEYHVGKN